MSGESIVVRSTPLRKRLILAPVAVLVVFVVWCWVLSPAASARRVAAEFMTAEARADCPTITRLSAAQQDPCHDLELRSFTLSMMEQTGLWHANVESGTATAWTTLAENVRVKYQLTQVDGRWLVVGRIS